MKRTIILISILSLCLSLLGIQWAGAQDAQITPLEDITIRFFVGGDPGDAFGSIVLRGAQDAEKHLGVKVDYVFSGWNVERMASQLRDAIAARPDGIAMMGHPGDEALMALVEEAYEAGIIMMYQNVDVPSIRARFGGGYIGAELFSQGFALGEKALEMFDLQPGDQVVVFGAWGDPGRYIREEGTAQAFEAAGLVVERIKAPPETAAAPELLVPLVTGAVLSQPDLKLICFSGGQQVGAVPMYMEAVGKGPGEIINIGFDLSPAVIDAFRQGYVQLISDQQPYLQGYLPILSIAMTKAYELSPINFDTGAGFVTVDNFEELAVLAEAGIR